MSELAVGASVPSPSTSLQTFHFDNQGIRTTLRNDEVWFVAADVCAALGLDSHRKAVERLDDDEKGVNSIHSLGGPQETLIVSESGLYSLILTSRKPEAKRFKRWVTHEVLPAIRKTGGYAQQPAATPAPDDALAQRVLDEFARGRFLLSFPAVPGEPLRLTPVPDTACVFDPRDERQMVELMREVVPLELLPRLLRAALERMEARLKARQA